jgi:hypothetical protein
VTVIIDKSSFVGRKRMAVYKWLHAAQRSLSLSEGLAMLPAGAEVGDLLVYLRSARVAFVIRLSQRAQRVGGLLQRLKIRQKLGANMEIEFLECTIIGECLVNRFDEFLQEDDTTSENTGRVASMLPVKKQPGNERRRIFVIS